MTLNISSIQHFSLGDGAGIRTTVFFKGCNLRCPWCHNPENLTPLPSVLRYKTTGKAEVRGKSVTVAEILPELLEDAAFYEQSGGGVTLSGGEPMLQAKAAAALTEALRERGIQTLIDTAGCVPYASFEALSTLASGYLFDFKTADPERYRAIGGDLQTVSDNLRRLLADSIHVQIRIPLIPEFNTDRESVAGICAHLSGIGVKKVELLPFHRLGSAKYEALGMRYAYKSCPPIGKEALAALKEQFASAFQIKIEE